MICIRTFANFSMPSSSHIALQNCSVFVFGTFSTSFLLFQFNLRFIQALKSYDMFRLTKWREKIPIGMEYKPFCIFSFIDFFKFFLRCLYHHHHITILKCERNERHKVNFISWFSHGMFYCAITHNACFFHIFSSGL